VSDAKSFIFVTKNLIITLTYIGNHGNTAQLNTSFNGCFCIQICAIYEASTCIF